MRIILIALPVCTGLAAGCAQPLGVAGGADDRGYWHRDAPGTIWKKNRIPDGGD